MMQGINAKEHQMLVESFKKFEKLSHLVKQPINKEEDAITKEGIKELRNLYLHFNALLIELESCTKSYEKKKKSIQSIMNKNIRKMSSELKKKNIHI